MSLNIPYFLLRFYVHRSSRITMAERYSELDEVDRYDFLDIINIW